MEIPFFSGMMSSIITSYSGDLASITQHRITTVAPETVMLNRALYLSHHGELHQI